jgi:Zn-dependent protease with chaperone function
VKSIIELSRHHVEVTSATYPELDRLVELVCRRLDVRRPPVFVSGSAMPNAFALGFFWSPKSALIVLTRGIVAFPEEELIFVLGHELGHLQRWHGVVSAFFEYLCNWGTVFSWPLRFLTGSFRIKSEYVADRFGLVAAEGDALVACRSLIRISTGRGDIPASAIDSDNKWYSSLVEMLGTHPFLGRRLREIEKYGREMYYETT